MEKKTKSITVTQFDYIITPDNEEEVDEHGHPNHYTEFDPEGNALRDVRYNRLGEFEEMFEYSYDAKGNRTREVYYLSEDEVAEEKTFEHDEEGQLLRAFKHYQDGSLDTISYAYDEKGQLKSCTTTTDEDEIEQVETFEWENGELVGHVVTDENGDEIPEPENLIKPSETKITTNEKGLVVTEEEVNEEGDVYMTINRSYLENDLPDEIDVFIDGMGRAVSRHYFLKYEYTYFE
jgi:antitoxin component YwqK of YwqJK toxin-antitoxin module